jgi:hypothetical protein
VRCNAPPLPHEIALVAANSSTDAVNVDAECLAGDDTNDDEEEATTFAVGLVVPLLAFIGDDPRDRV